MKRANLSVTVLVRVLFLVLLILVAALLVFSLLRLRQIESIQKLANEMAQEKAAAEAWREQYGSVYDTELAEAPPEGQNDIATSDSTNTIVGVWRLQTPEERMSERDYVESEWEELYDTYGATRLYFKDNGYVDLSVLSQYKLDVERYSHLSDFWDEEKGAFMDDMDLDSIEIDINNENLYDRFVNAAIHRVDADGTVYFTTLSTSAENESDLRLIGGETIVMKFDGSTLRWEADGVEVVMLKE